MEAATRTTIATVKKLGAIKVAAVVARKKKPSRMRWSHLQGVHLALGGGHRNSSSVSPIVFMTPPEDLDDGSFERPTPLLLVAGEGHPPHWWSGMASFLAKKGCTVGTMALTGRGKSATDTLSLRALQAGVAAAVDKSGLTPPVIVAHSMAGFVCQQFLQSFSASGLVLLDSFPPDPSVLAHEHLRMARESYRSHPGDGATESPPDLSAHDFAQLMKDDPGRWEGLLGRHFAEVHQYSPWAADTSVDEGADGLLEPSRDMGSKIPEGPPKVSAEGIRFPVKAFAQMCLTEPSSALRLESHVVETLVLGSDSSSADADASGSTLLGSSSGLSGVGDDRVALDVAKRDGLDAICQFHGTEGWIPVDRQGLVAGNEGAAGVLGAECAVSWQQVVWDWYDTRF